MPHFLHVGGGSSCDIAYWNWLEYFWPNAVVTFTCGLVDILLIPVLSPSTSSCACSLKSQALPRKREFQMNHSSWPASVSYIMACRMASKENMVILLQDCGLSWMYILCIAWIKSLIEEKAQQKNMFNTAVFPNWFHWHEMVKLLDGLLVLLQLCDRWALTILWNSTEIWCKHCVF